MIFEPTELPSLIFDLERMWKLAFVIRAAQIERKPVKKPRNSTVSLELFQADP
jgi:hypothetical protein